MQQATPLGIGCFGSNPGTLAPSYAGSYAARSGRMCCAEPDSLSSGEVNEMLLAFLTHVPNHVAAAAKLYADFPVTDVFGVDAVGRSEG